MATNPPKKPLAKSSKSKEEMDHEKYQADTDRYIAEAKKQDALTKLLTEKAKGETQIATGAQKLDGQKYPTWGPEAVKVMGMMHKAEADKEMKAKDAEIAAMNLMGMAQQQDHERNMFNQQLEQANLWAKAAPGGANDIKMTPPSYENSLGAALKMYENATRQQEDTAKTYENAWGVNAMHNRMIGLLGAGDRFTPSKPEAAVKPVNELAQKKAEADLALKWGKDITNLTSGFRSKKLTSNFTTGMLGASITDKYGDAGISSQDILADLARDSAKFDPNKGNVISEEAFKLAITGRRESLANLLQNVFGFEGSNTEITTLLNESLNNSSLTEPERISSFKIRLKALAAKAPDKDKANRAISHIISDLYSEGSDTRLLNIYNNRSK